MRLKMTKNKNDIQEKDSKVKSSTKKTKVKDETLESKVSQPNVVGGYIIDIRGVYNYDRY